MKTELGQNFLKNDAVIKNMVEALEIKTGETVIEIGPGLGAVTKELIRSGAYIYAIEIDKRFSDSLTKEFATTENIKIVEADILKWLPAFEPQTEFKIIGSLPYYITSPILHAISKMKLHPQSAVLLMQKEVAQKIVEDAPKANYLSTFVQTFFVVRLIAKVDRSNFQPKPNVDSAVIKLTKQQSRINPTQITKYESFLHKGFAKPRKMLNKVFTKNELEKAGIDGKLRPQNLNVEKWINSFLTLQ